MSTATLACVSLLFFSIISIANASLECGGPHNKVCFPDKYCCGNRPMKRPRVDEVGTPAADLTESKCVSHKDMTGLDQAEQLRRKKFICPLQQFRQFNGDFFIETGVPSKRPKGRQRYVRPLAAGLSWGVKGSPLYCTIGAILCSSNPDATERWFVSNKHCVEEDSDVQEEEIFVQDKAAPIRYEVTQPSASLQDKVENPHAQGPEVIGKVIFYYRKWVKINKHDDGYDMDISLIELDPKIPVRADVLVGDNPMKAMPVRGSVTLKDFKALDPTPRLCISGRSGGWGCFPVNEEELHREKNYLPMMYPHDRTLGTENINPNFLYPGNSGSVFWKKEDANSKSGYRAVGLFAGIRPLMPIHAVLNTINKHTGLDLHVCTAESNKFSKGAGRPTKNKKQFML